MADGPESSSLPTLIDMSLTARLSRTAEKYFDGAVREVLMAVDAAASDPKTKPAALKALTAERELFEQAANELKKRVRELKEPREGARIIEAVTEAIFRTARISSMADRATINDWAKRRQALEMRDAKKANDDERAQELDAAVKKAAHTISIKLANGEKFAQRVRPEVLKILEIEENRDTSAWPGLSTIRASVRRIKASQKKEGQLLKT